MREHAVLLVSLVLAPFACTKHSPPEPGSPPPPESPAEAPAASGEPTPEPTPKPKPQAANTLHPVALREGPLDLHVAHAEAYLLLDGEPIPLDPGTPPEREELLGRGLGRRTIFMGLLGYEVLAFSGDHVVISEDYDRSGAQISVYRLTKSGWEPREREHGQLFEYYPSLVTLPDGAVLGLRAYNLQADDVEFDSGDEGEPEADAYWAKVEAELAAAPRGFVVLSGSPQTVPQLPKGWALASAVADAGGRIVGLGFETGEPSPGRGGVSLLIWPPGAAEPTITSLPEIDGEVASADSLDLWATKDRILVGGLVGNDPYLAIDDTPNWTRIPIDEPIDLRVRSATITDSGELWITVGEWGLAGAAAEKPRLWRHAAVSGAAESAWEPVALASPSFAGDSGTHWVFDPMQKIWVEIAGRPSAGPVVAEELVWAEGTLWVLASAGTAHPGASDLIGDEPRMILYASRGSEAVELPSYDRIFAERLDRVANQQTPGKYPCEVFNIVVLDDADGANASARDELLARYEALTKPIYGPAPRIGADASKTRSLYVGATLDRPDRAQLILDAEVGDPKLARGLVAAVAKALGTDANADCRPRELLRMIDVGDD